MASTFFDAFLGMEAGKGLKFFGEVLAVGVACFGLGFEAIELSVQNSALEFAEAIVAGNDVVFVPQAAFDAAATVDGSARSGDLVVVGGDEAAFARS